MTRLLTSIHVALLCTLLVAVAGLATAAYKDPVTEVSMKWCTGEGVPNTNHFPRMSDGCRNGGVDSGLWTDTLSPEPGSLVQLDLFMKLRAEFLSGYGMSVRFDTEGNDVLDFHAMSFYNVQEFYPQKPLMCAPMGDPNEPDGGCEELVGESLKPSLFYPEEYEDGKLVSRLIRTKNPVQFPSITEEIKESEVGLPGWVYSIFALTFGDGIKGTTAGQNGPAEIRIGSIWFDVNETGPLSTIRASLARAGIDALYGEGGDRLDYPVDPTRPPPDWKDPETALTWIHATAQVPEPGLGMAQFAILAAVGWVTARRRRH